MLRRDALKLGLGAGVTAVAAAAAGLGAYGASRESDRAAVARLTVAPVDVELAPGISARTIAFDGTVPGPALKRSARLTSLELHNESDDEIVLHSPVFAESLIRIRAHACAQARLDQPNDASADANLKPYHAYCAFSGAIATGAIEVGTGLDGDGWAFDQLYVLAVHRWRPRGIVRVSPFDDTAIAHDYASFNDKLVSASEPIKVRYGDRVRFHFSNAGTTRGVTLALPHHRFLVVALDGHRVPTPRRVDRIYMGPGESIDALVTMDRPGRWILGATHREDRRAGLGRLVEYAGAIGTPVDSEYGVADWDYAGFGAAAAPTSSRPAAPLLSLRSTRPLALTDPQLVDPAPQVSATPIKLSAGERHRWAAANFTRDPQSLQLLNHDVELVSVAGRRTAGVRKDIVVLPSFTRIEFEFIARTSDVCLAHGRHVSLTAS